MFHNFVYSKAKLLHQGRKKAALGVKKGIKVLHIITEKTLLGRIK